MKPEVLVGTVRRRRRSAPKPDTPPPPNVRNWFVYGALVVGVAALMVSGVLTDRPRAMPLPALSQATEVRSAISAAEDSLQVIVGWDLTLSKPEGTPESVRVKVIPERGNTLILTQLGSELADTGYIAAPKPGQTAKGASCVAAIHGEEPLEEVCTPWQYVRPSALASAGNVASQIVIQPSGLQVDPDVDGRCADWQRSHPPDSVWIEVNLTAVQACTGPNRKPTVAQFCAFVVMPDGRRLKTANSSNNRYCEELFEEWIRERYS